jgi:hypothetical protein
VRGRRARGGRRVRGREKGSGIVRATPLPASNQVRPSQYTGVYGGTACCAYGNVCAIRIVMNGSDKGTRP